MNRRTFLKSVGAGLAALVLPWKWNQPPRQLREWTGGPVYVAGFDASREAKSHAHFIASGRNDEQAFQAAFEVSNHIYSEGTFYQSNSILLPSHASINGQGRTIFDGRRKAPRPATIWMDRDSMIENTTILNGDPAIRFDL